MNKNINNKEKMKLMWDVEKNLIESGSTFTDTNSHDSNSFYWICPQNGCSFEMATRLVYQRIYHNSVLCEVCHKIPFEKSLIAHAPERVRMYWNYERNQIKNLHPDNITKASNQLIFVKCDEHNWGLENEQTQICSDLANHIPCPYCNGKAAHSKNNLKLFYPEIAGELHPNFNAEDILPSSHQVYPWFCDVCNEYYEMPVSVRTGQRQGCSIHKRGYQGSRTETLLTLIFNEIIGDFSKYKLKDSRWTNGRPIEVDIYNPILKIGIEYDGYRHKNTFESDCAKNEFLRNSKEINLFIRIREEGLPELVYFKNQFEIICKKHERSFLFLKPVIKKALNIIKEHTNSLIELPSDKKIATLIQILGSKEIGNSYYIAPENNIYEEAPGLLTLLNRSNKINPKSISIGSNLKVSIACPECNHNYSRSVRVLVTSKGRCPKCLFFIEDVSKANSPYVRWHHKAKPQNSLAVKSPEALPFYSNKNILLATEISFKSSYPTIWNCPFCHASFESTNKKQVNNKYKCKKCEKKSIEYF